MKIRIMFTGVVHLFFLLVGECSSQEASGLTKSIKDDNICNQTAFLNNYVVKGLKVNQQERQKIGKKCAVNITCHAPTLVVYYAQSGGSKEFYFYIVLSDLFRIQFTDCWGFMLKIKADEKSNVFYINFYNKTDSYMQLARVTQNVSYQIELTAFPSGAYSEIDIRAPSLCENRILSDMNDKISEVMEGCSSGGTLMERLEVAESICLLYPDSIPFQHYAVNYLLSQRNCRLILTQPIPNFDRSVKKNEKPLELLIPLIVTSFLLFLVTSYLIVRFVKTKGSILFTSPSNDHLLQSQGKVCYTTQQDPAEDSVTTSYFKKEEV